MLPRDAFLKQGAQFYLYTIASMGPIIHQQEMRMIVIETGESALILSLHQVMGWEVTLWENIRRDKKL